MLYAQPCCLSLVVLHFIAVQTESVKDNGGICRLSSTKGFPSSPHLGERKKSAIGKKMSIETLAASASRLAALPATTNKTVFFLPGVDIKVCLLLFLFIFSCEQT